MLGIDTKQLWIGTIHSFCVELILKPYHMYIEELKYGYTIINAHDTESYLTSLCVPYASTKPKITYWDCQCFYFTSRGLVVKCTNSQKKESVVSIIKSYFQNLKENKEIDFELILYYSYLLLRDNKGICKTLSLSLIHI